MTRPPSRIAPSLIAALTLLLLFSTGPPDEAASRADAPYLLRFVFSGGGAPRTANGRTMVGTIGQAGPVGVCQGQGRVLYSGFWGPRATATAAPDLDLRVTRLEQNFPNPLNPSTRIQYQLAENAFVTLEVFNPQGRRIRVLVRESQTAGSHEVMWHGLDEEGRPVASGVYFYRLRAGQHRDVKRMLLLK